MKKMIFAAVAAVAMLASAPAFAQSVSVEGRRVDSPVGDSSELKLNYRDTLVGRFDYNGEGVINYRDSNGDVGALAAVGVQTAVAAPLGFTVTPKVEVGAVFTDNDSFGFWGVEATATRPIYGRFSGVLGVRHREGFNDNDMNEDRVQYGLVYGLTDTSSVGVNYYTTNGNVNTTAVGVSYNVKF